MPLAIEYALVMFSDWLDGSKPTGLEERTIRFLSRLGLYRPSYHIAVCRSESGLYLPQGTREALSFITATGSLDQPNFWAALGRLGEWRDRDWDGIGDSYYAQAEAVLDRWSSLVAAIREATVAAKEGGEASAHAS